MQKIWAICERLGNAVPEATLQFISAQPVIICILPGCKNVQKVAKNTAALRGALPLAFSVDLKTAGIMPAHAPVPQGT